MLTNLQVWEVEDALGDYYEHLEEECLGNPDFDEGQTKLRMKAIEEVLQQLYANRKVYPL